MKINLEEALLLLRTYEDARTRVLAALVTPSVSVTRVTGTIRVAVVDGIPPHLIVGREDGISDQVKFRLADCVFEFGEFLYGSAEDFGVHKFEGFLVVASKLGDTLSLFEPRS